MTQIDLGKQDKKQAALTRILLKVDANPLGVEEREKRLKKAG
jgi:hypothetical protein